MRLFTCIVLDWPRATTLPKLFNITHSVISGQLSKFMLPPCEEARIGLGKGIQAGSLDVKMPGSCIAIVGSQSESEGDAVIEMICEMSNEFPQRSEIVYMRSIVQGSLSQSPSRLKSVHEDVVVLQLSLMSN